MVKVYTLDAVVANVTNCTSTHKFSLVEGPFGLHEIESITSFPARDGVSRTVSIRTSDPAFFLVMTILLTFAIDRYLFKSRYLAHVGRMRKEKDQTAAALDESASLHEKEAFDVEAGEKSSETESEPESDTQTMTKRQRLVARVLISMIMLFFVTIRPSKGKKNKEVKSKEETPEKLVTDNQTEEIDAPPPPSSRWCMFVSGPIAYLLLSLSIIAVLAYQLLFWPVLLAYFIGYERLIYGDLYKNDGEHSTILFESNPLRPICYFAIWTIAGVTLMENTTRFHIKIWTAFRWTHAVTWWLFWGILEFHVWGDMMAKWMGLSLRGLPPPSFAFVILPFLFAYLCSGMVCNATTTLRTIKYLWDNDVASVGHWEKS